VKKNILDPLSTFFKLLNLMRLERLKKRKLLLKTSPHFNFAPIEGGYYQVVKREPCLPIKKITEERIINFLPWMLIRKIIF
jgi:hypothetical protein